MTIERLLAACVVALLVLLLYCVVAIVVGENVSARCLAHGYREASVTWNFRAYCVKRVDQTDVVVPLGQVEHGAR